ncbi:MAG TPA: 2-amino-4-hydroxy-6-hydroxymethyldihydropteridine diphosphokinase [Thermoanaerobaculia bacterium]|nr:2-amino-4-hydroxy-6-hydroxymethyldihydropteridine diphosphokinase [Thermoanaerobaculia bacterium]
MSLPVAIALGSNLGDREWHLRRAVHELSRVMRIVRVSRVYETDAVDAPAGSPPFLNMALSALTSLAPLPLLREMLAIERRLGRVRSGVRHEPRVIDLDLIFYDAQRMRSRELELPHPRWQERDFVKLPLREVWLAR